MIFFGSMCLIIDITRKISGLNMSTRAVLTQISLKMVNFSSFWRFFSFSDPYSTSTMAVIMANRVFFVRRCINIKKPGRNLALYIDNKKILTEMSKKMTIFWRFFYIFTTLGPLNGMNTLHGGPLLNELKMKLIVCFNRHL